MNFEQWRDFNVDGEWSKEIDVRNFIQKNYTPYTGDDTFLVGATEKTKKLWNEVLNLYEKERKNGGVLDADVKTPSTINGYDAGYIDKDLEEIVGLQTDAPLKRAIMPNGGIRIVEKSCEAYGLKVDEETSRIYHTLRRTHNDGVFAVYTPDISGQQTGKLGYLDRMLQSILAVTGPVDHTAQQFDKFRMDPVDTDIDQSRFTGFLDLAVHFLPSFFNRFFNTCRMDTPIDDQLFQ